MKLPASSALAGYRTTEESPPQPASWGVFAHSVPLGPQVFAFRPVRQPLFWAALAYMLGIVVGVYAWRPPLWWAVAALAFAAAAAYFVRRRIRLAISLALAVVFVVGALHVQVRGSSSLSDAATASFADGDELQLVAHVTREGRIQPGGFGELRQVVDIETEQLTVPGQMSEPVHSGVRLSIYAPRAHEQAARSDILRNEAANAANDDRFETSSASASMRLLHYGERIRVTAKLKRPKNFRNPGAFDYRGYLADNGISTLGSAKAENVELLGGFAGSRVQFWRSRIHAGVIAKVHELWPAREAALIDAMVIGEEAFIERDTRIDFQRSGTYHVLVVSGMNVSILAFVVFWTLRRLHCNDIAATLLTIAACAAYASLTEVGAPVWRATLMCAIYLLTRLLSRDRAVLNALGAAALGLLVLDPRQLFTASFQMTFLCVLIVAAIGVPMLERSSQFYRRALANWGSETYGRVLPPAVAQFRIDLRMVAGRLGRFVGEKLSFRLVRGFALFGFRAFELLFISAVMQMGLALPMAWYFHRATTLGTPANLAVVPLVELLMPAAIAALALGYVSPWLAKIPAFLAALAVDAISGTVHGLGGLRSADLRVATPSTVMVIVAAAALAVAMVLARQRIGFAWAGIAVLFAASLFLAFVPARAQVQPGVLEVTSIDVGEGDSILLVTPRGRTLLVDAGGPIGGVGSQLDFGEDVVSPYLWSRGISRLDAVAITHGHSDHIGGMPAVLRNFRPRELWVGVTPPSYALENLLAEANALGVRVVRRWEGDEFDLGGANVSVLFPPRDLPVGPKPENNDSLVMRVSYKASSVLLEGDAEKQVERRIARDHHPAAELLKVGHHGSANATTPELVDSVRPEFAVISVGLGNSFGLPRKEILSRLEQAGSRVYRTDLDGAMTFYLDGRTVTPRPAALP